MLSSKLDKGSWSQSARNIRAALENIRSQPGFREEDMIMDISSSNTEQVHEETQPAAEQNVSLSKMDDDDYDTDSDSDSENDMAESKQQVLARKKLNEPKEDDDEMKRKIAELQAQILAVEKKLVVARLQEEARQREQQKAADAEETNTSKLTVEDATEWTADSDDDSSEYTEVEVEDEDDDDNLYEESVVMEETASTTPTMTEEMEEEVKDERVYTCEETEERVLVNWESQETFFRRRQAALRPAQVSLPGATMSLKERMRQFQVNN
jgi:hypothetical protein